MKKICIIVILYSISAVSHAYNHSTSSIKTTISKVDYKNESTLESSGSENNEPIQINYAVLTEEQREALRKFILINLHWL
ncbi:hypothetical protein H0A36_29440 [Endozoicomonas sp. SM1973]|uniref:Uncharacterized protein n=1 Tax=Spartinivicinus marinus TaxID=2994442 RepID=A0A853I8B5_9GAMM|nr:hypothetical protein [Spartinivicinus marinus]MCX4027863.1 hypothetical protein [Spartinivicinus marinus]NYZ70140.1 hypothetical protein [Spartinivicinus marinus]